MAMTTPSYDRAFWEQLWEKTLRDHPDKVAKRPPSAHMIEAATQLAPGRALDAGCGHGAETLWLAAHGWQVTAVDFSSAALAHARTTAEALGADIAARIDWREGDLATWTPPAAQYDLVICLFVHIAGEVEDMVRRMASGVAPGGTLLMLGHRALEPAPGAVQQVQVSVEAARAVLDDWELVAEEQPRTVAGAGVDVVIRARRRKS